MHSRSVLLAAGGGLGLASLALYHIDGYGHGMLLVWLAGLLMLGLYFWLDRSTSSPRISRRDAAAVVALVVLFAPLYLLYPYDWPVQVITDEPTIMDVAQDYSDATGDVDPFGVSTYQTRPTLLFLAWGNAGELIGGIDLFHMRLLHALVGLITVGASYALFRQLLSRPWAVFATCLFGFSHSFLMISRLAMRENTAVLVEVVALALLLWGLRHGHAFWTYVGGIVAGLGFYTYHPGRATFPLWLIFLVLLALLYRDRIPLSRLASLGATSVAGFVMMAGPLLSAESKAPRIDPVVDPRAQLMITAEGRELQRLWVHADTTWEGYRKNIDYALTAFNNEVVDHGWIYVNPGHGFVDPLTGILVWIGAVGLGLWLLRRRNRGDPWPLLMLSSFLALLLAFAFLVNQAPKYPRLLITLPFVAYLVTEAVRWLGGLLQNALARRGYRQSHVAPVALAGVALVAIAGWNLFIAWDYIDRGRTRGEPIGNTGRYIAANPDQAFYLVADEAGPYQYFTWGHPEWWQEWLSRFTSDAKLRGTFTPNQVSTLRFTPPFGLFMSRELVAQLGPTLAGLYPSGQVRRITPTGEHMVFEVRA